MCNGEDNIDEFEEFEKDYEDREEYHGKYAQTHNDQLWLVDDEYGEYIEEWC